MIIFAAIPFVYASYRIVKIALDDEKRVNIRQYTVIGEQSGVDTTGWERHEADETPSGQVEYTKSMERTRK